MMILPLLVLLAQTLPSNKPSDPTIDWLLTSQSSVTQTSPTTIPASQPFTDLSKQQGLNGTIKLSNGQVFSGIISTTPDRPIRIWNEAETRYEDVLLDQITQMKVKIVWERDEKEWHFKESGSDIKVFTGKSYPAREYQYEISTKDGQVRTGGVVAPIYLSNDGTNAQFILHKRDKGLPGQKLADLVYISEMKLDEAR